MLVDVSLPRMDMLPIDGLAAQGGGAYVEQIPLGAKPAPTSPLVLKISPNAKPVVARQPPPGVYVQVANSATQEDAVKAGLDLSQRLGRDRPAFIRGLTSVVDREPRIVLFAGPFTDEGAARHFCAIAVPDSPCRPRLFAPERQTEGPVRTGPLGKGD